MRTGDKLVVIADDAAPYIADALARMARLHGCELSVWRLDELGRRPHQLVPQRVVDDLLTADGCVFVAGARHAELGMRQHLLHLVQRLELRHAHMPGISALAFSRGCRIDYGTVAEYGERVREKLERARCIRVESPRGTSLDILMAPRVRWFAQLGLLERGRWGNLPAGALYANPSHIEGRFVADACVGEYFGERAGLLQSYPVSFQIEGARVVDVSCPRAPQLEEDIRGMLAVSESSARVGLVCVGVNVGIKEATGEALVDQNLPGLHLAIGDPAARVTGAGWSAPTSFAVCQSFSSIVVDDAVVVSHGKLLATN